ncbi:MAG: PhzF family phenazine biosynthesis protein [Chloroherpetonaceae bacterium]|nr:PhzF family phenazine biosynthesis protein [Chloroherpetonaceae bacterium]MDW8437959.1 PhzF family phenazine biosynthesis protein [Chloroherpetonaceae bacterium]
MKTYQIKHVDAFTDRAFTGNPAAVVLDASGLDDEQMQLIAREMNLPETAFVLPAQDGSCDLELRWFTPTKEVDLCGHGTVATFHALAEEKMFGLGEQPNKQFRVKTRSGILPVSVERRGEKTMVKFGVPVPKFEKFDGQISDLFATLSVPVEQLDRTLPVLISSSRYLYLPFVNREPLLKMSPDFQSLKQLTLRRGLAGVCVFTTETKHPTSAAHSRFFAPALGIDEDPVTGSAQGELACYLYLQKRVSGENGAIPVTLEQGYVINRGGRVWAELVVENGAIQSASISGYAITVLNGNLLV